MKSSKKCIAFSIILFVAFVSNAQKANLQLSLAIGSTYDQVTKATSVIVQTIDGTERTTKINVQGMVSFTVNDLKDTVYSMAVQYRNLSLQMETSKGKNNFSSDTNNTDLLSRMLSRLINKPFYLAMTVRGKITKVSNIDKIYEDMFTSFPELTAQQKEQVVQQLQQGFSEKALKGSMEAVSSVYPVTQVSKNDKWFVNTQLLAPVPAEIVTEYQLLDINNKIIAIHGDGKFRSDDKGSYIKLNGYNVKYNLSGKVISDLKLDKKTGWVREARFEQIVKGSVIIKSKPDDTESMTIPILVHNETDITDK